MSGDSLINHEFGQYIIKHVIADGGMATVYCAYDKRRTIDVAFKVLNKDLTQMPDVVKRFERETDIIRQLHHLHIVPLYDAGRIDDQLYLTMRLMDGGTLIDRLGKNNPIPPELIARWLSQIASALDYAHNRGIVHRDIKPGNILMDRAGNVYLADFGVARIAGRSQITMIGVQMPGTVHYMSPEQVAGKPDIDGRSDIYSLGILTYVLLALQYPYDSPNEQQVGLMHMSAPIPHITDVKPDLPPEIDEVLTRALAKLPSQRYPTAGAFAADFTRVITGRSYAPLTVSREPKPVSTPLWKRRPPRRWFPIIGGAVVLTIIIIIVMLSQ